MPDKRYYGKYRATVVSNEDPLVLGRLMLQVPDVLGEVPSSWALPCLPAVGKQMGVFALPAFGSTVWAEFEQGNPDYPIWVGGFWGSAVEVPPLAVAAAARHAEHPAPDHRAELPADHRHAGAAGRDRAEEHGRVDADRERHRHLPHQRPRPRSR